MIKLLYFSAKAKQLFGKGKKVGSVCTLDDGALESKKKEKNLNII